MSKELIKDFVKQTWDEDAAQLIATKMLLEYERFREQQSVKGNDYTVLSYWSDGSVYNGVKDEKLFVSEHPDAAIHTIMRLYDGVEFTLGNPLTNMNGNCRIEDFYKDHKGNKMWISTNNKQGYGCALSVATKTPIPAKPVPNPDYVERPPLGLKPFKIHHEQRLAEINAAINRYMDANLVIPNEWIAERETTLNFIK